MNENNNGNEKQVRADLVKIYNDNKVSISYETYHKDKITSIFCLLEQGKEILVGDYPYGFNYRTDIKYWIETTKRGDRFVSQTLNPKTNLWNKPKKGTYVTIKFLVLDSTGKVTTLSLDMNATVSKIEAFKSLEHLMNDSQKAKFIEIQAFNKVMANVKVTCQAVHYKNRTTGEVSTSVNMDDLSNVDKCTPEGVLIDEDEEKAKDDRANGNLDKAYNYEIAKLKGMVE